jgi:hypothetical protein
MAGMRREQPWRAYATEAALHPKPRPAICHHPAGIPGLFEHPRGQLIGVALAKPADVAAMAEEPIAMPRKRDKKGRFIPRQVELLKLESGLQPVR